MLTRRKLRDEIVRLTYRVAELEERLCPCEDHDWVRIAHDIEYGDYGLVTSIDTFKCRRCGKSKKERGM